MKHGVWATPKTTRRIATPRPGSRRWSEIRKLDGHERLVEDNSPCNYDHVAENDLNSWHFYIDDHDKARRHIEDVVADYKARQRVQLLPGLSADEPAPLINSEYGAVSAGGGDRDISWGFRDLTTQLRRHPKIQGFVYTELTDIEWEHNGLANYDRTPKVFGYDTWVPDLRPRRADWVLTLSATTRRQRSWGSRVRRSPCRSLSATFRDRSHPVKVRWWVSGYDSRADLRVAVEPRSFPINWRQYDVVNLEPLQIKLPDYPFVVPVAFTLRDEQNQRFAANFVNLVVKPDRPLPRVQRRNDHDVTIRFAP